MVTAAGDRAIAARVGLVRHAEPEAREVLIEIVKALGARKARFAEPAAVVLAGLTITPTV